MIIKITPDREKAASILNMVKNRKEFISSANIERFPTIAVENYYEIIKELATAILLLDGIKATGESAHKETIDALSKYRQMEEWEISLIDDLRLKRNKSSYEGKQINISYLENKKDKIIQIIEKLENLLRRKLK
jgi:hypothetical protein